MKQAIKFPIIVFRKKKLIGKERIRILACVQPGMIKVGLTGYGTTNYYH